MLRRTLAFDYYTFCHFSRLCPSSSKFLVLWFTRLIILIFSEKLAEATRKMENLKADLQAAQDFQKHGHHHHTPAPAAASATEPANLRRRKSVIAQLPGIREKTRDRQTNMKNMHDIKLAFSEFYLSLILLQNYQTLNFTGFRKILKKHDKVGLWDRKLVCTKLRYYYRTTWH